MKTPNSHLHHSVLAIFPVSFPVMFLCAHDNLSTVSFLQFLEYISAYSYYSTLMLAVAVCSFGLIFHDEIEASSFLVVDGM